MTIKKIPLLLCSMLCFFQGALMAQQSINSPSLTQVLPPAPDAAQLTKYSGLPINLSSGNATVNIPLGSIKEGGITVPISLSYNSGGGVRINQLASTTGTNWSLNAGGVISRTVYGRPDETSKWVTPPANASVPSTATPAMYQYLDSAVNDLNDTQADMFNFECNGYSGRFYLKPSDKHKVMQLSASPLKFETNFDQAIAEDWTFRITDPNGNKYEFGGSEATEKSRTVQYGCGKSFDTYVPTAWYLARIVGVHGEEINFTYTGASYEYFSDISETKIRTPQGTLTSMSCSGDNCPLRTENQVCGIKLQVSVRHVSHISSKLTSAHFFYQERDDVDGDKLLAEVEFGKRDGAALQSVLYDQYTLDYVYGYNNGYYNPYAPSDELSSRPFLRLVERLMPDAQRERHTMSYYNINGLPSRLSFAQDYWGFFNGRNNTTLIPTSSEATDAQLFGTLANREPDANYAYYGLLSKIVYPTGGADSLQYEPNTVYETRAAQSPQTTVHATRQGTGTSTAVSYSTTIALGMDPQLVTFDLKTTYGTGTDDRIHQHSILEVKDQNGTVIFSYVQQIGDNYTKSLLLPGGNITVTLTAYGQATIGEVLFRYYPQGTFVTQNYQTGGVRVARNISSPNIGRTLRKRYIYAALDNQGASSGALRQAADANSYYANLIDGKNCPDYSVSQCTYRIANSTSVDQFSYPTGGHIFYRDVIVVDDEQWKNGGTAHHFLGSSGWDPLQLKGSAMHGVPLTNIGIPVGVEDATSDFFITGTNGSGYTYKIVKKTEKHYVLDPRKSNELENFVVKRRYLPSLSYSPPNAYMFEPFDVEMYYHEGNWLYADSTTVTQYDLEGNNPIVTTTKEVYGNTDHLQPTQIITNMSDDRTRTMSIKYPHDMVADGNVSPYDQLVSANRIGMPIIKSESVNGTAVQSLKTSYRDWGNSIVEPDTASLKMGPGSYSPFITFHGYNAQGKLTVQSKTLGAKTSYKYGYLDQLPIAECSNASTTEFYFENFEDSTTSDTSRAHTGDRSFNGDFAVAWTPPSGRTYRLTYFYELNGDWIFAQQAYTGPTTLTLGNAIDDVAIYPVDAILKSVTFDPAYGVSSMIDETGKTIYYGYDSYGRLEYIRDQNRDIIKHYKYFLVHGTTGSNAVFYNTEQSQSFTKSCTAGVGDSFTYVVPAGSFSSNISQADADDQALAEIAANGQAYANSYGSCYTADVNMYYTNDTNIDSSTSLPSGGITTLNFKDANGSTVYSFTQSQLNAGVSVAPGTYNLEFVTYGTTYDFHTHKGWTMVTLSSQGAEKGSFVNTNATGGIYTINGVTFVGADFNLLLSMFYSIE